VRLLLVGAFPYPHHQGSQIYFQEQAIALRAVGLDVELLTYGSGLDPAAENPGRWRALDGFVHHRSPAWTTPRSMKAGPGWGKPRADLGLGLALNDALASKMLQNSYYDAILTHNVEACFVALSVRKVRHESSPPIIFCVHTLLGEELSTYSNYLKDKRNNSISSPALEADKRLRRRLRKLVDASGRGLDRAVARRVDGWIALTQSSHRVMRRHSNRPGALIPPPLPDPRHWLDAFDPRAAAKRHRLPYKDFYLYSGNLDGYQELEWLVRASQRRSRAGPKIVVASHDPAVFDAYAAEGFGLESRLVESEAEMISLTGAARATLVPRRTQGGFPIKLANSLAVGTAPIAFLEKEWGLRDGENALIARGEAPEIGLAQAIDSLDASPELATRLGKGARALYESNHRPQACAEKTALLIQKAIDAQP